MWRWITQPGLARNGNKVTGIDISKKSLKPLKTTVMKDYCQDKERM